MRGIQWQKKAGKRMLHRREKVLLTFIVNPNAGGENGYRVWRRLERMLVSTDTPYQVILTAAAGEAAQAAARITEKETEERNIIIAVGGDGTLNEIADSVRLSDKLLLGYVPAGHHSEFARLLNLPHTTAACFNRVLSPNAVVEMPYGIVRFGKEQGHRRFLVNSGCGFDAAAAEVTRRNTLRCLIRFAPLRKLRTFMSTLNCLKHSGTARGYLLLDGKRRVELNHIFMINAEVGTPGVGFLFRKRIMLDTGRLTLSIVHTRSRLQQLRIMFALARKKPIACYAGVRVYLCDEARVVLESPLLLHTDGESCGLQTDMEFHCAKRKLKFLS